MQYLYFIQLFFTIYRRVSIIFMINIRSIRINTNIGQLPSNDLFELKRRSFEQKLVFIQIDRIFKF